MDKQDFVYDLCQRYSTFLTGQAGTGKTFLLKQLISSFNLKYGSRKVGLLLPVKSRITGLQVDLQFTLFVV